MSSKKELECLIDLINKQKNHEGWAFGKMHTEAEIVEIATAILTWHKQREVELLSGLLEQDRNSGYIKDYAQEFELLNARIQKLIDSVKKPLDKKDRS